MAALGCLGVQPVVVLRDNLLGQVPDVPVKILPLQPAMRSRSRRVSRVGHICSDRALHLEQN